MAKRTPSKTAALDADTRILVLHGPEDMVKREHFLQLLAALEKAHGEVELHEFDGATAQLADVLDELRGYSLMQQHKVVVVDQAEHFVREETRPALERYAASPVDHATLVLRSAGWRTGRFDKLVAKVGAVIKCSPPSPSEAASWARRRVQQQYERTLEPRAAQFLVDRLGPALLPLDSELAKLALMVEPSEPISVHLVEQVVGRSSEEKAYAVQRAICEAMAQQPADPAEAIAKVHELIDLAGHSGVPVAYFVADLMRKLHLLAQLRRQRVGRQQAMKQLRLWPDMMNGMVRVLDRLGEGRTLALLDRVVELDRRSKSGFGEPVRNLEGFCVTLADELDRGR
jgi:DNA polymerase-3 subunit delta